MPASPPNPVEAEAAARELAMRSRIPYRDPAAITWAFQTYWEALCRQVRLILPPGMDRDGAAGEVMLRFVESAPRYDPRRPLYPWLARICTHVCLNERRSLRRFLRVLLHPSPPAPGEAPARDGAHEGRVRLRLLSALQQLSEREIEAVSLRYLFDVEREEVARLQGVDPGSVKRTLTRALAHLREGPDAAGLEGLLGAGEEGR